MLDYTASLQPSQHQPSNQLDKPSRQDKQAFKRQATQAFQAIVQAALQAARYASQPARQAFEAALQT